MPVLEVGFPRAYVQENLPTRLELLKQAPGKLRKVIWTIAMAAGSMALTLVKSHYPRVDLGRVEEGYAADVDDDAVDALHEEVGPAAEIIASEVEIDGRSLTKE